MSNRQTHRQTDRQTDRHTDPTTVPSLRMRAEGNEHVVAERASGGLFYIAAHCQISPIGLIPKPHQLGKWRLMVDLSSFHGASVNGAIPEDECHMHYASVLDAATLVRHLRQGNVLGKV